ncbi:hypothetical protein BGZ83_007091 [Gryganskiella cystojenkinii]|nr:hypothetical protein BGZ83_007091 [Gryganskiella cystojenkinii]
MEPQSCSCPRQNAVLIPELAFQIQLSLNQRDLSIASQVSKAWHKAWAPLLYYAVQYRGGHRSQSSLMQQQSLFQGANKDPPQPSHRVSNNNQVHHHQVVHGQGHLHHHQEARQLWVPPFINFKKFGHWIKSIEACNLFVLQGAAAAADTNLTGKSMTWGIQDHLTQIQTCPNLNLTRLEITKTVMSLERLDRLLSALPGLLSFQFEVMNKPELISPRGGLNSSIGSRILSNRGLQNAASTTLSQSTLLLRTQQVGLQGLEPEVVRVIARRLCLGLESLGLTFELTGRISLPAFEELFDRCGSTLKTLSLTRAEICERNYEENIALSVATADILSSLLESTSLSSTSSSSSSSPMPFSSSSTVPSKPSTSCTAATFSTFTPTGPAALESLTLTSCAVPDRECEWLLRHSPRLLELNIHDSHHLGPRVVGSILRFSPLLESLSWSSVHHIGRQSLARLFERADKSDDSTTIALSSLSGVTPSLSAVSTTATTTSQTPQEQQYPGLRLKRVKLAYLRGLDDNVMRSLATHQGSTLERLSVQWCPDVTDAGVLPIFSHCSQLEELCLCLSKLSPDIFKPTAAGAQSSVNGDLKHWACEQTLQRLEIGGQMFLNQLQLSNVYLQPQLYHHLSPNPHRVARTTVGSQGTTAGNMSRTPTYNRSISSVGSLRDIGVINNSGTTGQSNVLQDSYTLAHHEGYPMYHLHQRYEQLGDPFGGLKTRLATMPRLYHLGVSTKGVEHLIRKGFGPNVKIQSLALLGQQGRKWSLEEVKDLLEHMPTLTRLHCEKNTILPTTAATGRVAPRSPFCGPVSVFELKMEQDMVTLLRKHGVEVVQSAIVHTA